MSVQNCNVPSRMLWAEGVYMEATPRIIPHHVKHIHIVKHNRMDNLALKLDMYSSITVYSHSPLLSVAGSDRCYLPGSELAVVGDKRMKPHPV